MRRTGRQAIDANGPAPAAIEGQPLLVIDAMTLRPAEDGRLELTLDLHGWRRA